jgi:cell division protein FtsB
MQPLIVGISQGSGGTRVLDDIVQTFLPVSKATGGPVAVVQLDQPFAFAEARIGGFRSMVRMGFGLALAVSLLLLGLTFVSSRRLARAPEDDEQQAEADEGVDDEEADMEAEEQPVERLARELQTLRSDLDEAVVQDTDQAVDEDNYLKDLEADVESQEAMRQRRDELKARAKEAELRVKKLEAELHPAPSAPKSEQ